MDPSWVISVVAPRQRGLETFQQLAWAVKFASWSGETISVV